MTVMSPRKGRVTRTVVVINTFCHLFL
ncbi:hypothetical protein E2C01_071306 [Portunus trituberculatus]|uniref:Uncharacterized protein n=1 Tax=Portunus trituberculatus TaxID=210409 RepID=A0A5B7HV08_PORTR|nr:hypothetical protein [Portunus trituberculatus]